MKCRELRWELERRGFTKVRTGGKECYTETWTLNGGIEALATYNNRKNEEYPILLDKRLLPKIGNNNIYPTPKKSGMPVPHVSIDGRPQEKLHKILMENLLEDGKEIDHKNHNRFCITLDNLRIATSFQNGYNKRRCLQQIYEDANGKFFFKSLICCGADDIGDLEDCNYAEIRKDYLNTGYYYVESKHFDTTKECGHEARHFNDCAYGDFSYHVENDFEDNMADYKDGNIGKGTELLIRHRILGEFGKDELLRRNIERLRGIIHNGIPLVDYI